MVVIEDRRAVHVCMWCLVIAFNCPCFLNLISLPNASEILLAREIQSSGND